MIAGVSNSWSMAGTEGTGEYVVAVRTHLGRIGYRSLDRGARYRIRIEPARLGRSRLDRVLTRSRGWKQPGDQGQDRYSAEVTKKEFADALGLVIPALEPGDSRAEVNPSLPRWLLRVVKQAANPVPRSKRSLVFFCHSHKDRKWLARFQSMLKPAIPSELLWDDTKIAPGTKWKHEIRKSLERAKVAVLLVSEDFLASDFILKNELPLLLDAEEVEGLTILWVPLSFSMVKSTQIYEYQPAHDPSQPLNHLKGSKRQKALVAVCEKIKEAAEKP